MSNWNRALSLDNSKILGIINLSNDSFSGDGVFNKDAKLNKLLNSAKQKNINFIDVGCASTKPGFDSVTTEEEIKRLNYFKNINQNKFSFSIDSFNPIVTKHAVENNFEIINDVSGFMNEEMIRLAVDSKSKIILVHRHPKSESLHHKMIYKDVVKEVKQHLDSKIKSLISLGVREEQIAIDPGLGFGKNLSDSVDLLLNIKELKDIVVFDLFDKENGENTQKSISIGLIFQAKSRTLKDTEIDGFMSKVIKMLETNFQITIR